MTRRRRDPIPLRPWLQHFLLAGPVLGTLATLHSYSLELHSPSTIDVATSHVVRQTRTWHGRYLGSYYITPSQHLFQECLAFPTGCWMISVVAGLVLSGIRVDAVRRQDRRNSSGFDR